MNANLPTHVIHNARTLNLAGKGRAPGSFSYIDPGRGDVRELFVVEIFQVGSVFGLGRVANNLALPSVRLDHSLLNGHGPLELGMVLLAGPLSFEPNGRPKAHGAWPVKTFKGQRAAPVPRQLGRIPKTLPSFGFIPPANSFKASRPGPAPQELGRIQKTLPTFGFIRPLAGGTADVFFHASEAPFVPKVGLTVRFTPVVDERGLKAVNVRLA